MSGQRQSVNSFKKVVELEEKGNLSKSFGEQQPVIARKRNYRSISVSGDRSESVCSAIQLSTNKRVRVALEISSTKASAECLERFFNTIDTLLCKWIMPMNYPNADLKRLLYTGLLAESDRIQSGQFVGDLISFADENKEIQSPVHQPLTELSSNVSIRCKTHCQVNVMQIKLQIVYLHLLLKWIYVRVLYMYSYWCQININLNKKNHYTEENISMTFESSKPELDSNLLLFFPIFYWRNEAFLLLAYFEWNMIVQHI